MTKQDELIMIPKSVYAKLLEVSAHLFILEALGVDNATDIEVQRRWGDSITAEEYLKGTIVPEL